MSTCFLRTLALTAAAVLATAQEPKPAPKTIPQAAPVPVPTPAPEPVYVTTRDFKNKLFFVRHRAPRALAEVLRPLLSGYRGATLEYTDRDGLKTLSVRDFPENLAAIEEALKRLDMPLASRQDLELEFHIHVLLAHRKEGPSEGFPEELKDVLKSLKSTLVYRSFTPVASFVHRAKSDARNLYGRGSSDLPVTREGGEKTPGRLDVDWRINGVDINASAEGSGTVILHGFSLRAVQRPSDTTASLDTDLSLKDGEKVVVGTSTLKDQGLIVVLTVKVLK